MKICPVCNQKYKDESLNFCLNDGTTLTTFGDEPPPTVVMDMPRKTNPNFSDYQTNFDNPNQQIYQQPFAAPAVYQKQDQTLPIISLILGIIGVLMLCAGFPLGLAAAVTGYIGMKNANKDPMQYGGKGMAIAGIVLGAASILMTLGWIFFIILAGSL